MEAVEFWYQEQQRQVSLECRAFEVVKPQSSADLCVVGYNNGHIIHTFLYLSRFELWLCSSSLQLRNQAQFISPPLKSELNLLPLASPMQ